MLSTLSVCPPCKAVRVFWTSSPTGCLHWRFPSGRPPPCGVKNPRTCCWWAVWTDPWASSRCWIPPVFSAPSWNIVTGRAVRTGQCACVHMHVVIWSEWLWVLRRCKCEVLNHHCRVSGFKSSLVHPAWLDILTNTIRCVHSLFWGLVIFVTANLLIKNLEGCLFSWEWNWEEQHYPSCETPRCQLK